MTTLRGTALAAAVLLLAPAGGQAATLLYFSMINSGGGQHTVPAMNYPISGVMTAQVPRFNPVYGTLTQADFEFFGNTNGSWTADPGYAGTMDISLSGLADVGGQSMGNLVVGFPPQAFNDQGPTTYGAGAPANATFNSGAFFLSLTGVGNETLSWNYAGASNVNVPAIGLFDWGGTAHVLYTYEPVPEPAAIVILASGALAMLGRWAKRSAAWRRI